MTDFDLSPAEEIPAEVLRALSGLQMVCSGEAVDEAVDRLSVELTVRWQNDNPVVLILLPEALVFAGMLLRRMIFPLQVVPIVVGENSVLAVETATDIVLRNRNVLLLVARYDPEHVARVTTWAHQQEANQVEVAALCTAQPDILSAVREDAAQLIGSGLTVQGYGGNLPGLYALATLTVKETDG